MKRPTVNDSRRRDARRAVCRELAKSLGTPEGLRSARLLLMSGAAAAPLPSAAAGERAEPPSGPRPISVWRPRRDGGELVFERPEPLPVGDHYAARRVIRARKADRVRRVVLFGESVAAGYLYAPHLTPAEVLETQLRHVDAGYEVVDLARTNETLAGLTATVESALQLDPDALVIFAGNNWNLLETPEISPYVPSLEARQRYAQALADGGSAGPARLADRTLRAKATAALDDVARLAAGVPVIVVVPEVNLADWESRQPAPWLPGEGGTREWYRCYHGAISSLEKGEWRAAVAFANKMLRFDGATVGTTCRLLARAEIGRGRHAEARWAARAEVDRTSYATLAFLDAPRATTGAQEILRGAADRHRWEIVDLPEVFGGASALPGRRLFLDYCHLTADGMRIAMAAVASAVVGRLESRPVDRGALSRVGVDVAPAVEATARFGAALHGAHRLLTVGGARPILEHWCRAALEASPAVADTMLDLVSARASAAPAVLTAAQGRNFESPYRLLLQHGWRWDFLDAELVRTIGRVLDDAGIEVAGQRAGEEIDRLVTDRLGAGPRGSELARPPFLWEPLERLYPEVMDFADAERWAVLRAPWPCSSFCLVHDGACDAALELTARLPPIDEAPGRRSGHVTVVVNGRTVGRCPLGERWTHRRFEVGRGHLRRGMNRVTLVWPELPPVGDAALRGAVRRLELGHDADVHPIFGEVSSLRSGGPGRR